MDRRLSPNSPYTIGPCKPGDFEEVKRQIMLMELDDRELHYEQFLTAHRGGELVGFGRVREYNNLSEMCSLGIVPAERSNGLAKALVQALAEKAKQTLYLVCIIPGFFTEFGFLVCHRYPLEMQDKLDYCTSSLAVPEPYVVMKRN